MESEAVQLGFYNTTLRETISLKEQDCGRAGVSRGEQGIWWAGRVRVIGRDEGGSFWAWHSALKAMAMLLFSAGSLSLPKSVLVIHSSRGTRLRRVD